MKENLEKITLNLMVWLYKWLRFGYLLSLVAVVLWFFGILNYVYFIDLLSHFTLQYMIGGFLLAIVFLAFKEWKYSVLCFVISCLCMTESRFNLQHPLELSPPDIPPVYNVVTYNHNVGQTDFAAIREWLTSKQDELDVVILQEANAITSEMAEQMRDIYPYQVHEYRNHAFGMVILSKLEFIEAEKIALKGPLFENFAVKLIVESLKAKQPLTIYALHPHPPTGPTRAAQRDFELNEIARIISENRADNILMIGDLNITPFAPAFGHTLRRSGLNFQSYGLLLDPTWPNFTHYSFLRIPIDHAFFSDNLIQVEKTVGEAFGSDHRSLYVSYAER